MSDTNSAGTFTAAPDVQQSFNESAPDVASDTPAPEPVAETSGVDQAPSLSRAFEQNADQTVTTPDLSVSATARGEIDIIDQAEAALAQHDDRWRQLSDRLANRPAAAPSLDMEGGAQRSVGREYTEYRREWSEQRDAIEYGAIREVIDVRANGTTLTNEFSASSSARSPETTPEPALDPAPSNEGHDVESRFQREFRVADQGPTRTVDR